LQSIFVEVPLLISDGRFETKYFIDGKKAVDIVLGRRRRMNPMNVKALRRATRRIDGFTRTARRALKHTGYMLVSRHAKGASRGVITRAEAARALKR